jgi:opacity protein-like surface antigen
MCKSVCIASSLFLFACFASAQIPSGNVFFGYSYYNTNLSSSSRTNTNGWDASVEGKVLPWVGLVADFDGHFGSQSFPVACPVIPGICSAHADFTEHNYLFGPRVSVSIAKIRPFAQVLFGAGHVHVNGITSDTSFATAVGGGLDYKLFPLLAWRVQGDYVHTHFFSTTQNNVRLSTGIVVHF